MKPISARARGGRQEKTVDGNSTASSRPRPKIQNVASQAGVSLGTVSAVINGNGRISDATRERVQDAITQLGYRPDLYASNLARRQTQLFGVVVSSLQNPFFAEVAQAIEDEAARHQFRITLTSSNFSPTRHFAAVQQLLGARIAGIAVITSEHDRASQALIASSGVRAVYLDGGVSDSHTSVVRVDSKGGMQAAVSHLLRLGHRSLLFVRNSQDRDGIPLISHKLRDQGFAAAIRSCSIDGVRTQVVDVPGPSADAGEKAVQSAFEAGDFTAIIAITDMVAMGVYRGLQSRGLRIPEDVSVVGFDNTYFSRFLNPPLTTVDIPRDELSRIVVAAMLKQGSSKPIFMPTTLVLRESTAKPRKQMKSSKSKRDPRSQ